MNLSLNNLKTNKTETIIGLSSLYTAFYFLGTALRIDFILVLGVIIGLLSAALASLFLFFALCDHSEAIAELEAEEKAKEIEAEIREMSFASKLEEILKGLEEN